MKLHRENELARQRRDKGSPPLPLNYEDTKFVIDVYNQINQRRKKRDRSDSQLIPDPLDLVIQDNPERVLLLRLMADMVTELQMEYSIAKINILCHRVVILCSNIIISK